MLPIPEKKYRLMAPGPVMMPPGVYEALASPMVHHRTPLFEDRLQFVLDELPHVFGTRQPVMMLSSTGTGGMEAALVNTLSPGERILSIVSGKFGQRWSKMAKAYGIESEEIEVPWGEAVSMEQLKSKLENGNYAAVITQATETSTATWHPIEDMGSTIKAVSPETLLIVDGITAVAASPLKMDTWNIDVLVAGSQKAFMIPTGLAFVSLSEKAWEKSQTSKCPKFYFDLKGELNANKKGQTLFSSNVALITALYSVLQGWKGDGLDRQLSWYRTQHESIVAALKKLNLEIFSSSPSSTVTAFKVPNNINGNQLRKYLEEEFQLTLMGGQDHLKGKIIRIGHMGHVEPEDVYACIFYIAAALKHFNYNLTEEIENQVLKQLRENLGL
tara:strand:+ start:71072 stop:72232 length:1161 start_codon:yes stop_codon:yes gene_type:complete